MFTGTPEGVGALNPGDKLSLAWDGLLAYDVNFV